MHRETLRKLSRPAGEVIVCRPWPRCQADLPKPETAASLETNLAKAIPKLLTQISKQHQQLGITFSVEVDYRSGKAPLGWCWCQDDIGLRGQKKCPSKGCRATVAADGSGSSWRYVDVYARSVSAARGCLHAAAVSIKRALQGLLFTLKRQPQSTGRIHPEMPYKPPSSASYANMPNKSCKDAAGPETLSFSPTRLRATCGLTKL